jgi:membrane-associated protease RseP (regulator of RpoE activity)
LFLLTALTTTLANGPLYSAAVMGILLFHEMGHFLMCRHYRVVASLPHFIPLPPQVSFIGTLGAVIGMRPNTGDRRTLFDIGIAGPLAGFALAVPITLWGLHQSQVVAGPPADMGLYLGESLLFQFLEWIAIGPIGSDDIVILHPVALAGWTGLFVTGLNLIPAAMLDGGHIVYGLIGRRSIYVAYGVMIGLAALALTVFVGWWMWFGLLLLLRVVHPAHRLSSRPIDRTRIGLGIAALVLFIICFVPVPISFNP